MSSLMPPCKGCNERNAECHCICEKYKEYAKKNEELREKRLRENFYSETKKSAAKNKLNKEIRFRTFRRRNKGG